MPIRITIAAGPHPRENTPVSAPLPGGAGDGNYRLGPKGLPAQVLNGRMCFICPAVKPGKPLELAAEKGDPAGTWLTVTERSGGLDFAEDGKLVTRYHFSEASELPLPSRPYFYPVNLGSLCLTRHVPRKDEPLPNIDHHHHKSLWVAHGDVNGSDNWSDDKNHGFQRHLSFSRIASGPVAAEFEEALVWEAADGRKLLEETRTFRMWKAVKGGRFLDLEIIFKAAFGDVVLGDTKEGGICAVRVREPLQGDRGGLLANAHGGVTEPEIWGYRSPWIDDSGKLDGRKVGIAILDHPGSFRHPTHWHARDYGLIGANPFAWHDYGKGWSLDGSYTIKSGLTLPFRYRLYLHEGDCGKAGVARKWIDYAHPPEAKAGAS